MEGRSKIVLFSALSSGNKKSTRGGSSGPTERFQKKISIQWWLQSPKSKADRIFHLPTGIGYNVPEGKSASGRKQQVRSRRRRVLEGWKRAGEEPGESPDRAGIE
ncbi:hypothetical protein C8F04DRAFT_1182883 [Mycena alexandri]|uniref:Uncharacterized protein n=1 Tax=Mycena alexandri TaxID=1745969 RepID=A0AAD6X333_9AGAR|nr:hypothetical protein C8F04DRAFT_1182872 [Mycena alexandri]KAJ7034881.1 hypothetical protein C8F04DRAFT_1182883 [Mycena alexandri]